MYTLLLVTKRQVCHSTLFILRKPCDYPFWVYIGRGDLPLFCAKEADGQVSQPVDKVYQLNNKNECNKPQNITLA